MYNHILFAADLSPQDDNPVLEKAYDITRVMKCKVTLLHVIEEDHGYVGPYITKNIIEERKEKEERTAKEYLNSLGDKMGVPEERQLIVHGQAKKQILKLAEELDVDLLVLGSHGRHGLNLLLLGSTASGVLHGAKCDVLAVRVYDNGD
jgi:universal stress protein A